MEKLNFFPILEDSGRSQHDSDLTLQKYAHEDEGPALKQDCLETWLCTGIYDI